MKKTIFTLALALGLQCLTLSAADVLQADYNVVPLPHQVTMTDKGSFTLSNSVAIVYPAASSEMQRNATFLAGYIKDNTKLTLNTTTAKSKNAISLVLSNKVKEDEGYTIEIKKDGIVVSGKTPQGVFYGIQTLRKSLPVVAEAQPIVMPTAVINDSPRFSYRGMHLDCGRHFFPIEFIKEYIDLIAMHNMNKFHWHLTEDQGWRIEIKKYPKLTEIGSKRSSTVMGHNSSLYDGVPYGGYYTQEQAREIVKYAADRYITVIPEIDMPGHMLAALASYPELGCTGGPYTVGRCWGVYHDVLCLGNEKTYQFCEDVLSELMDIFPSKYINIGGDESPNVRWKTCPKCQKVASEHNLTPHTIQGYFTNRMEKFINSHGRSIIGWDEILEGDINQSATILSWRGSKPGIKAAQRGHDVIMSPTSHMYFDFYQTDKKASEPQLIGGCSTVENVYSYEPVPDTLDVATAKHIFGVQANVWTEYMPNSTLVEYQILPRMAALSEVQWATGKKDYEAFKTRLTRLTNIYDLYKYTYAIHLWKGKKIAANGFEPDAN